MFPFYYYLTIVCVYNACIFVIFYKNRWPPVNPIIMTLWDNLDISLFIFLFV